MTHSAKGLRNLLIVIVILMLPTRLLAQSAPATAQDTLQRYIDAFNQRDLATMGELLTENASWYYVEGDQITPQDQGRKAIITSMRAYFGAYPDVRTEISRVVGIEPYLSVIETVSWGGAEQHQSQSALAVYQINADGIEAVWYYPAVTSD